MGDHPDLCKKGREKIYINKQDRENQNQNLGELKAIISDFGKLIGVKFGIL